MPYMIKCWILVDVDEPEIYETEEEARLDYEQAVFMQPENKYEVVECDEDGSGNIKPCLTLAPTVEMQGRRLYGVCRQVICGHLRA